MNYLLEGMLEKIKYDMDKIMIIRPAQLELCKTQEERDRLEDRWAMEDGLEDIADAIRYSERSTSRFLGIF